MMVGRMLLRLPSSFEIRDVYRGQGSCTRSAESIRSQPLRSENVYSRR